MMWIKRAVSCADMITPSMLQTQGIQMKKAKRIIFGIPIFLLFSAWALWEFGHLRLSLSAESIGFNTVKLLFMAFASYVAWRAWRWVSGKDGTFGKTAPKE